MGDWQIERLSRSHGRAEFDCGNGKLSDWLRERAGQWEKKQLARVYVAVARGETRVAGYYAISSHHVRYEALPENQAKGLPRMDVPVVLLGQLAVDASVQGQGLGQFLLIDALRRAEHVAEQLGVRAVEVEAIDEAARRFYLKFGFTPLADDPDHLFLPISLIRKLGLPPLSAE